METRMGKLASGLALVLLSAGLGGCQLLGSEKASEANDSAASAPKVVPAEKVQPKAVETKTKADTKIIAATPLTRPTDPDVRVKAIKKGRSNPFAQLVAPAATRAEPLDGTQGRVNSGKGNPTKSSVRPALPGKSTKKTAAANPSNSSKLPRLENPASIGKNGNDIVLPPLPEPTLAKKVSVQGVMMLGGQPKAILKAPNEDVTRTVQAGDYLAGGQILVQSIDMSNPQNPKILLQESGQTVTVGVGRQAETVAAAVPF